jgi:hypothetical protein
MGDMMFNSIFGALGQAAITGTGQYQNNSLAQQNYNNQASLAQQQALYNQYAQQRTAKWMINGEVCYSVKDFAKKLYPEDEQAQLMIILKFGDV